MEIWLFYLAYIGVRYIKVYVWEKGADRQRKDVPPFRGLAQMSLVHLSLIIIKPWRGDSKRGMVRERQTDRQKDKTEKRCSPLPLGYSNANVTSSFIPYYHQTMEGEGEKNTTGCFSEQKKYNNYDYLMIGHLPLHCKIETNRALKINILTYHISWVTYNVRSYKIVPSSFSHQNIVSVKRNLYALCKYCERIYFIRLYI